MEASALITKTTLADAVAELVTIRDFIRFT
ncbi:MAG: hypothetical protein RJA86_1376, partial [Pseudomonadota bacterium]